MTIIEVNGVPDRQVVQRQHAAGVGRPPGQAAPPDRHGEGARAVGGQEGAGLEIGPHAHHARGMAEAHRPALAAASRQADQRARRLTATPDNAARCSRSVG